MIDVTAGFCFRNQEQKLFQTVIVNKGVSQNSTKKPGYQAAAAGYCKVSALRNFLSYTRIYRLVIEKNKAIIV